MKFDYIIMNPPYNGNLHLKILEEAMKHSDNVVNLSPNIFASYRVGTLAYEMRNIFKGRLADVTILSHREANDLFGLGNAINELAIYNIKKEGTIDIDTVGFNSPIEAALIRKVREKRNGILNWENKNTERHGKQEGHFVNLYTWHVGKDAYSTCINETGKNTRTVYFDNEVQLKNFKDSFKTTFMEWFVREIVWKGSGITDKCFMFEKDLYNTPWTDERFYKFFDLTADEIKIIEKYSKKF